MLTSAGVSAEELASISSAMEEKGIDLSVVDEGTVEQLINTFGMIFM
jgi:hypothetical protein